jgi:hypothetical protein
MFSLTALDSRTFNQSTTRNVRRPKSRQNADAGTMSAVFISGSALNEGDSAGKICGHNIIALLYQCSPFLLLLYWGERSLVGAVAFIGLVQVVLHNHDIYTHPVNVMLIATARAPQFCILPLLDCISQHGIISDLVYNYFYCTLYAYSCRPSKQRRVHGRTNAIPPSCQMQ